MATRPGAPSRVIQGFFPGGRPSILQPATGPVAPIRPQVTAPVEAGPASPPAPMLTGRQATGSLQPALRPGQVPRSNPATQVRLGTHQPGMPPRPQLPRPIMPPPPRPAALQPFASVKPHVPGPIVPQAASQAILQPQAGNAFALPANFSLKPRGSGQPLPEPIQKKMESFFNTSFADVRIHVGHEAASIGALAFTHGTDLYFAPGQYNPQSTQGQQLLGHELTHVVQQRAGRVRNPLGSGVAVVQDPALEAEAERMGLRAASATAADPGKAGRARRTARRTVRGRGPRPNTVAANGAILPNRGLAHDSVQRRPGPVLPGGRSAPVKTAPVALSAVQRSVIQMLVGFEFQCRKLRVLKGKDYKSLLKEERLNALKQAITDGNTNDFKEHFYIPDKGKEHAFLKTNTWYLTSDGGDPEFVIEPPLDETDEKAANRLERIIKEIKDTAKSFGKTDVSFQLGQKGFVWVIGGNAPEPEITGDPQMTAGIRYDRISAVIKRLGASDNVAHQQLMTNSLVKHYEGDDVLLAGLRKKLKKSITEVDLEKVFQFDKPQAKQAFGVLVLMASYVRKAKQLKDAYMKDFPLLAKSNFVNIIKCSPFGSMVLTEEQLQFFIAFICGDRGPDEYVYTPEKDEKEDKGPTIAEWVRALFDKAKPRDLLSFAHNPKFADSSMGNLEKVDLLAGKTSSEPKIPAPIVEFRRIKDTVPISQWETFALAAMQWVKAMNDPDTKVKKASDFPLSSTPSIGATSHNNGDVKTKKSLSPTSKSETLTMEAFFSEKGSGDYAETEPATVYNLDEAKKQKWSQGDQFICKFDNKLYVVNENYSPGGGPKSPKLHCTPVTKPILPTLPKSLSTATTTVKTAKALEKEQVKEKSRESILESPGVKALMRKGFKVDETSGDGMNCLIRSVLMGKHEKDWTEATVDEIRKELVEKGAAQFNEMLDLNQKAGKKLLSLLADKYGPFTLYVHQANQHNATITETTFIAGIAPKSKVHILHLGATSRR